MSGLASVGAGLQELKGQKRPWLCSLNPESMKEERAKAAIRQYIAYPWLILHGNERGVLQHQRGYYSGDVCDYER